MGPMLQQPDHIDRQWGQSVYVGVTFIIKKCSFKINKLLLST